MTDVKLITKETRLIIEPVRFSLPEAEGLTFETLPEAAHAAAVFATANRGEVNVILQRSNNGSWDEKDIKSFLVIQVRGFRFYPNGTPR